MTEREWDRSRVFNTWTWMVEGQEPIERISARARISQAESARRRDQYNEYCARRAAIIAWSLVGIFQVAIVLGIGLLIYSSSH